MICEAWKRSVLGGAEIMGHNMVVEGYDHDCASAPPPRPDLSPVRSQRKLTGLQKPMVLGYS